MKTLKNIILIGIILCFFGCTKTGDGPPNVQGVLYATEDMSRWIKTGDKVFEGEFKEGGMYKGKFYQTICKSVCEDLVGFYPFNGNAKDFSGNGNHGDVYGAKLTSDSKGHEKSAYLFNGKDSYIELPNQVKGSSFTFSAYVKVNKFIEVTKMDCGKGGGSRAGIITFAKDGLQLMNCSGWSRQTSFPDNYYKLWFQIHSFCSTDNCVMEDQSFSRNNAIQIGQYYLFTISINKETGIASLYQDTKLIDKKRWEFNLGNRFYIGIMDKNNLMKPGALSGVIDEIRIYNKALNDIEVKEIYESLR
jgi:hypothetical protein